VPVPTSATFPLQTPQARTSRRHSIRERPTTWVWGLLWKGTLNHPWPCFPGTMHEKRVLILPSWPHPKGTITSCPPESPYRVVSLPPVQGPCRDAGAVVPTHGLPRCQRRQQQIPGKRFPALLPSRSLGWESRWPEPAQGPHLSTAPAQPSGMSLRTCPPRRDHPIAYPRAQHSFHGGRQTAPAGRGRQPPGLQGLKVAPWPGAALPRQPKSHGKSWQAPLGAAGG